MKLISRRAVPARLIAGIVLWLFLGCVSHAALQQDNQQSSESVDTKNIVRVLSFNILQGGGNASNVGFPDADFNGSRIDEIAQVILFSGADIVGVQENAPGNTLLEELNRQGSGWQRYGAVYSRWTITPIEHEEQAYGITVCQITSPDGRDVHFVNCHWYPSPFGPELVQQAILKQEVSADPDEFSKAIVAASQKPNGYRGYDATIRAIQLADSDMPVIVTGDFNEPSHLDWTERYAREGADRWVGNPTDTQLRFHISWPGSQRLLEAGLLDAWRTVHTNEVDFPGHTWTPEYPEGTPGRRPAGDQMRDRIDMVYFSNSRFKARDCVVIGESLQYSAKPFPGKWPSDHRAVYAELQLHESDPDR